jgi:hypothetical protein
MRAIGRQRGGGPIALSLLVVALFVLRVCYGLSLELASGDSAQIYLLGLKFFTTGRWPFFGPDVVHTDQQIAGPLQGLVVGVPLFLTREPEAPLILLNVFSLVGLVVFGIYLARRFPLVPPWITCAWLLTCPWTLNYSTHVYNPSYLLSLSCFFFVGFFELVPSFTGNLVPPGVSFFMLGFSLAASSQFHLSWPLLVPFLLISILTRARERLLTPSQIGWLLVGTALPLALVVPTVTEYGFASLVNALGSNTGVTSPTAVSGVQVLGRFLSFASFEPYRFLGFHWDAQLQVLRQSPWLIPFAVALGILGLVQPFVMLVVLFVPRLLRVEDDPCRNIRWVVVGTLGLIWVAFWFTSRPPITRNYYILCPVALLTGYLAFGSLIRTAQAKRWAVGIVAAGAVLHVGLAAWRLNMDPWTRRRSTVMRAIQQRDYRVLGERRPHAFY